MLPSIFMVGKPTVKKPECPHCGSTEHKPRSVGNTDENVINDQALVCVGCGVSSNSFEGLTIRF